MRGDVLRRLSRDDGQMAVELAVILPAVIVVAVTIANIMTFLGYCAAFDRASLDAVIAHGVSPAGIQSDLSSVDAVESSIEEALGGSAAVSVEVSAAPVSSSSSFLVSLCPHLVRFTCTMRFVPWPRHLSIAGVVMDAPFEIVHTRSLVVDRYRPGVVM